MAETENTPKRTATPSEAEAAADASADVVASPSSTSAVPSDEKAELNDEALEAANMAKNDEKGLEKSLGARSRGRLQSKKLDRTLAELESAFSDWDAILSKGVSVNPSEPADTPPKPAANADNAEFKKRTRHLLMQLRQQLREL